MSTTPTVLATNKTCRVKDIRTKELSSISILQKVKIVNSYHSYSMQDYPMDTNTFNLTSTSNTKGTIKIDLSVGAGTTSASQMQVNAQSPILNALFTEL